MTERIIAKPEAGEFAPYAIQYIGLLPDDGRILARLADNYLATRALLLSVPEDRLSRPYAEGKWTIKQIVQHVSDDERIYAYRALRFARGDRTELPGFDQDPYAAISNADARDLRDLLDELGDVRRATIALFAGLDDAALLRRGVADGKVMSVRAAAYHVAGHELRHVNVIRERYL